MSEEQDGQPATDGATDQQLMKLAYEGRKAQELFEDPHIRQYFRDLEVAIYGMLRAGTPEDAAHWHRMLDCADKLRDVWAEYIRTGAIAVEKLKERQHPLLKLSRFKWIAPRIARR